MRYHRQNRILELISTRSIETQEELVRILNEEDFKVTQATISRDIRELKLVKTTGENGKLRYALASEGEHRSSQRYGRILQETVISCSRSENMIVVKTLNGCANASCEALDSMKIEGIMGTIAGDNTIFVVAESSEKAPEIVEMINNMIKGLRPV